MFVFALHYKSCGVQIRILGKNQNRSVNVLNPWDLNAKLNDVSDDVLLKDGECWGNIDHIIVGPRGIFGVETKNIQKDVIINGDDWKGLLTFIAGFLVRKREFHLYPNK